MRRTLAIVLGVSAALAVGTATAAEVWHSPAPVATSPTATAPVGVSVKTAEPKADLKAIADSAVDEPNEAGKVEAAQTALGYVGSQAATFRYPGVDYVKVHFTRLALLPGDVGAGARSRTTG